MAFSLRFHLLYARRKVADLSVTVVEYLIYEEEPIHTCSSVAKEVGETEPYCAGTHFVIPLVMTSFPTNIAICDIRSDVIVRDPNPFSRPVVLSARLCPD
uniref:RES domain-containing protein n=1 Tax=Steinernema glaseri TaxID=37863 RepID=A0A1I7Y336_9BILA